MYRLKADLENTAFRTLYPRQGSTAIKLYYNSRNKKDQSLGFEMMESVADNISSRLETIFSNDEILINQLKGIEMTSRVKKPYSLWKKDA